MIHHDLLRKHGNKGGGGGTAPEKLIIGRLPSIAPLDLLTQGFDLSDGSELLQMKKTIASATCYAVFDCDGNFMLLKNTVPYLTKYDANTGAELLTGGNNYPNGMPAVDRVNNRFAMAHYNGSSPTVWDCDTLTLEANQPATSGRGYGCMWDSTGNYLYVGLNGYPGVTRYDYTSGVPVRQDAFPAINSAIASVSLSKNRNFLAATKLTSANMVLVDGITWADIPYFTPPILAKSAVFSADETKMFLFSNGDNRMWVYDTSDFMAEPVEYTLDARIATASLAWASRDGSLIGVSDQRFVRLYDSETITLQHTFAPLSTYRLISVDMYP